MCKYLRVLILACAVGTVAGGCVMTPARVQTRHFVLAPVSRPEHALADGQRAPIAVASVKMPSYLLRDSMVVRRGEHEFRYLETALWAERLDQSFRRTLAQNLSVLLASGRAYVPIDGPNPAVMRVSVDVQQFDVDTEGRGTLIAEWRLTGAGGDKAIRTGQAHLTHSGPSPHGNPQAIATTLSGLTADFSRDLVQVLGESVQRGQ